LDGERTEVPQAPAQVRLSSGARRWLVVLIVLAVVLAVAAGGLVALRAANRSETEDRFAAAQREVFEQANVGSWPDAKRALDDQAAALVRGDEKGWLAAVDPQRPQLREQYRRMFTNLRQLGVTAWSYNVFIPPVTAYGRAELEAPVTVAYCLHTSPCPAYAQHEAASAQAPSTMAQRLSMTRRDGAYVITAVAPPEDKQLIMPWEREQLVFAQGKRVTVAATRAQAHRLREVVAAGDQAAAVTDRYARYIGNQQRRYRLYLASDAEWSTWFGGAPRRNAIGYAIPIGLAGTEVVLKMADLKGGQVLKTVRHELGHVVTLSGSDQRYSAIYDVHEWLVEGVAEYIAFAPKSATANPRHQLVRSARRLPATVAVTPLTEQAKGEEVNRFYGLGHHAVSCMVDRFGERRFFDFFKRVLRDGASYREASEAAFGRAWESVDRDCVASIRRAVG
jgi:hypothetical protein